MNSLKYRCCDEKELIWSSLSVDTRQYTATEIIVPVPSALFAAWFHRSGFVPLAPAAARVCIAEGTSSARFLKFPAVDTEVTDQPSEAPLSLVMFMAKKVPL